MPIPLPTLPPLPLPLPLQPQFDAISAATLLLHDSCGSFWAMVISVTVQHMPKALVLRGHRS